MASRCAICASNSRWYACNCSQWRLRACALSSSPLPPLSDYSHASSSRFCYSALACCLARLSSTCCRRIISTLRRSASRAACYAFHLAYRFAHSAAFASSHNLSSAALSSLRWASCWRASINSFHMAALCALCASCAFSSSCANYAKSLSMSALSSACSDSYYCFRARCSYSFSAFISWPSFIWHSRRWAAKWAAATSSSWSAR